MKSVYPSSIIMITLSGVLIAAGTGSCSEGGQKDGNARPAPVAAMASDLRPGQAPAAAAGMSSSSELTALPNPVYNRNEKVLLTCKTRTAGTALVNIYDAAGSIVFETSVALRRTDAVGYTIRIPWDCTNRMGRCVGNGTYLAVIRIFDVDDKPVERHTVRIGIAY
jgi:hypothetical protein